MDDLTRLGAENECRKLMLLYCWHIDHLDPEAFAGLFAADAEYKPAAEPVPMVGREAIRTWADAYPKEKLGRHVSTNQIIEVADESNATGVSYSVVFRDPAPAEGEVSANVVPRCLVEYVDTFKRTDEGWKFTSRCYRMIFLEESETNRPRLWQDFPTASGSLRVL